MNFKWRGFTLIELLCAVAIGMLCIVFITPFIIYFQKTAQHSRSFSNQQEAFRFSSHFLRQNIAQAGFMGCKIIEADDEIHDYGVDPIHQINTHNFLQVFEDEHQLPKIFKISPKLGSDIVLIRKLSSENLHPLLPFSKDRILILAGLKPRFESGDDIAIADCQHIALLKVQSVKRSTKNQIQTLFFNHVIPEDFSINAYVGKIDTIVFFVNSSDPSSLYMKTAGEQAVALAEDINNLKADAILTSTGAVKFIPSSQISDWSKVQGLSINLDFGWKKSLSTIIKINS